MTDLDTYGTVRVCDDTIELGQARRSGIHIEAARPLTERLVVTHFEIKLVVARILRSKIIGQSRAFCARWIAP